MVERQKSPERPQIWIFDLTWLVIPLAFYGAFEWLYARYGPQIENGDENLLVFEALLLIPVLGFTLLARMTRLAGWHAPKSLAWLWLAGPLWLGVAGPLMPALENIAASPSRLALWTGTALLVALNEETLFRGFMLRGLIRSFRPLTAVLLSSIAFGLIHFLNLSAGGDPLLIGAQMLSAMGTGSILAAMTLRTGSIWPAVLIHFLVDVTGLAALGGYTEAIGSSELAPSVAITGAVLLAWGLFWSWRIGRSGKVVT